MSELVSSGADVHLLLIGKGSEETRIEEIVDERNLRARVTHRKSIDHDELPDILNAADAFLLLPSVCVYEVAALEALACGTPAIVSDVGAFRDYVNREDGIRVNLDQEEREWVPEILRLLKDGRRPASTKPDLSWDTLIPEYTSFFDKVIVNRRLNT